MSVRTTFHISYFIPSRRRGEDLARIDVYFRLHHQWLVRIFVANVHLSAPRSCWLGEKQRDSSSPSWVTAGQSCRSERTFFFPEEKKTTRFAYYALKDVFNKHSGNRPLPKASNTPPCLYFDH